MPVPLKAYYNEEEFMEVGIDEAGAGCLAGPLYVAAVILPRECPNRSPDDLIYWDLINDSKKVTPRRREILKEYIKEIAIDYSIVSISRERIDEINILQARLEGFHQALRGLTVDPDFILVDGDRFNPYYEPITGDLIPYRCIPDGDNLYKSIASASILAKTERDSYMKALSVEFPEYSWDTNKGYGTAKHIEALQKYGATEHHRRSFNLHIPTPLLVVDDDSETDTD